MRKPVPHLRVLWSPPLQAARAGHIDDVANGVFSEVGAEVRIRARRSPGVPEQSVRVVRGASEAVKHADDDGWRPAHGVYRHLECRVGGSGQQAGHSRCHRPENGVSADGSLGANLHGRS